jgi:hypothetical protein
MARPQVADGGDGLQIWRVVANMLNKQSRTADKKRPSSLELGVELTTPHHKKLSVIKCYMGPWIWTDSLDQRKQREMNTRFGKWNVRSLQGRFTENSRKRSIEYLGVTVTIQRLIYVEIKSRLNSGNACCQQFRAV